MSRATVDPHAVAQHAAAQGGGRRRAGDNSWKGEVGRAISQSVIKVGRKSGKQISFNGAYRLALSNNLNILKIWTRCKGLGDPLKKLDRQ